MKDGIGRLRLPVVGPHGKALVAALGVLVVLLPVWWAIDCWYVGWEATEDRKHAESQLSPYAERITSNVMYRLNLLHSLGTLVALKVRDRSLRVDDVEEIEDFILETIARVDGIRDFALVPDGARSHVYPYPSFESILSRNLPSEEYPDVPSDIQRAIFSGQASVSGPFSMRGDDLTLIAWQPLYRKDAYWGLVAAELDLQTVLNRSSGLPPDLDVAVRDSRGRVFYGPSAIFESEPAIQVIQLPDGYWEVAGVPTGGWDATAGHEGAVVGFGGLVIIVLLAGLVYLVVGRESLLAAAVEERTRELSRADDRLKVAYQTLEQRVAARTRQLSTIHDVTALASASQDLGTTLQRCLDLTVSMVGGHVGTIQLLDGDSLRLAVFQGLPGNMRPLLAMVPINQGVGGWVLAHGEPLMLADVVADPRVDRVLRELGPLSCACVPIRVRGRTTGVLTVTCATGHLFSEEETALLVSIGGQVGVAVESARLLAEIQGKAVLEERQRLARDLHDSVTQLLYSLTLMAAAGRRLVSEGNLERADEALGRLGGNAQQALKEMRLLVHELRPLALENNGLVGALQERFDAVERRVGVEAQVRVDGRIELSAPVEECLYRVAQEAMNNALKHSNATSVTVRLGGDQRGIKMEIEDNGKGFDPDLFGMGPGLGLVSMRQRVERLGGSLSIRSLPGVGTTIGVRLSPLTESSSSSLWPQGDGTLLVRR